MTTYSDWRRIAPIETCPACGCRELMSRDAPTGLEIACRHCEWREELTVVPPLEEWPRRRTASR